MVISSNSENTSYHLTNVSKSSDITNYVISFAWSGDISQASRKLNFTIAYTVKDKYFVNADVELGDKVLFYAIKNNKHYKLFEGQIFLQERNTNSFTMEFVAYDNMITLAKSKYCYNFKDVIISNVILKVLSTVNISLGECTNDIFNTTINFTADNMSGTEIIKNCIDEMQAKYNKKYHFVIVNNKLNIVEGEETVDDYHISTDLNLFSAKYSASIENMVNQVQVVDKDGNTLSLVTNHEDKDKFNVIQTTYRLDEKKNTATEVNKLLKSVEEKASVNLLGNFQCISGYAVNVKERISDTKELNGLFTIVSDNHKIENNKHTMDLNLEFRKVI